MSYLSSWRTSRVKYLGKGLEIQLNEMIFQGLCEALNLKYLFKNRFVRIVQVDSSLICTRRPANLYISNQSAPVHPKQIDNAVPINFWTLSTHSNPNFSSKNRFSPNQIRKIKFPDNRKNFFPIFFSKIQYFMVHTTT